MLSDLDRDGSVDLKERNGLSLGSYVATIKEGYMRYLHVQHKDAQYFDKYALPQPSRRE